MVGYFYNKYEYYNWSGASFSDMHACRCKFNRHDCWLGATVKDMTNGRMQLLQTWPMAGANITVMDADKMKL